MLGLRSSVSNDSRYTNAYRMLSLSRGESGCGDKVRAEITHTLEKSE